MNKTSAKVGISIILASIGIATLGFMIKISHDNCLEMIRAFERGESGVIPLCQADGSAPYFLAALPVVIIGIFVLVLAKRDAPILQKIFGAEARQ